jgi:hypothetical protein
MEMDPGSVGTTVIALAALWAAFTMGECVAYDRCRAALDYHLDDLGKAVAGVRTLVGFDPKKVPVIEQEELRRTMAPRKLKPYRVSYYFPSQVENGRARLYVRLCRRWTPTQREPKWSASSAPRSSRDGKSLSQLSSVRSRQARNLHRRARRASHHVQHHPDVHRYRIC